MPKIFLLRQFGSLYRESPLFILFQLFIEFFVVLDLQQLPIFKRVIWRILELLGFIKFKYLGNLKVYMLYKFSKPVTSLGCQHSSLTIFIRRVILIFHVFATLSAGQCLSYLNGDTYPNTSTSYCTGIINWPVSNSTFNTSTQRDEQALANYTSLYQDYYQLGFVDLDCLGMARYFFCASAYPTCTSGQDQIYTMCSWICTLFSTRCGTSISFYQQLCVNGNVTKSNCSYEKNTFLSLFILALVLILFF